MQKNIGYRSSKGDVYSGGYTIIYTSWRVCLKLVV